MSLRDFATKPPDVDRGLVEVLDVGQALVVARHCQIGVDAVEDLVCGCKRACGLQDEQPVVAGAQHMQLAIGADVVDTGIGACVGEEDEAFVEAKGHAVSHEMLPQWLGVME